jgi:hypothetical protein
MKLLKNDKGQASGVQSFILAIVGAGVVLAIGLVIMVSLQATTINNDAVANATHYCANGGSAAWNGTECISGTATVLPTSYGAVGTFVTSLATIPTWIGILITVALAFVVLGYFYSRK